MLFRSLESGFTEKGARQRETTRALKLARRLMPFLGEQAGTVVDFGGGDGIALTPWREKGWN